MATETEFAPAKVNLTLHVTGRRQDGYHLLDSLVVFAGVGDRVSVTTGEGFSVTGPQAALLPPSDDNLCLRAARAMGGGVAITLDKVLPVASGIGGGSADAAATLRALARMGRPLPDAETVLKLGADVPVCLSGHAVRMTGVGEGLAPVSVPPGWMVLVNPGVAVSTPSVFRALDRRENPPMPTPLPPLPDMAALVAFVASQRNDLEAPAIALAPVIADVKAALAAQDGCLLARMSGSGATCFGLFAGQASAEAAARAIRAAQPGWWAAAAPMLG
ncbi:4-(cytidine 5'-diphospho)-2-C-methyl-D-erythritol kinase [Pseudogemmobacter blasticus]|uniref:4-diphosphocytidyl-2-C-methyl-D-erythritol kinase n=1 Tax=Fuscovulum blasticum DSM 2131 TaxID=1188250 RepID=A0A2T4JF69_FUSBL|nr:4-(cytidine 5'-diphospho)-2-C-methyl-D-erythritol kinase [Fuscovulum blasticum]PTE16565.1 4-(cytidine 5'-diphospho)-2-C-methyl-D-erythritol kinase [Fuscovulum blasticum DSM 2131]